MNFKDLVLFHEATNLNLYVFDQTKKLVTKATAPLAPDFKPEYLKQLITITAEDVRLLLSSNTGILGYFLYQNHFIVGWTTNYNLQGNGNYESRAPLLNLRQFQAQIKLLYRLFYSKTPQLKQGYLEIRNETTSYVNKESDKQINKYSRYQGFLAEQDMLAAVSDGDLKKYTENYRRFMHLGIFGTLSENQLRSKKNLTITSTTLFTRAAIRGGMPAKDAYALSDTIIRNAEEEHSIANVYEYTRVIGEMFLRRVQQAKRKNIPSIVYQAQEYIYSNLAEIHTVAEIATYLGISKSYLMHLFKATTNQGIMSFVTKLKVDEAKHQLIFSNEPLAEIAYNLGFKNQGQFSRTFKQQTGISPLEFRKQMRVN